MQTNSSNFFLADTLYGHSKIIWSVAFTPDGRYLVSAGKGEVKFWNLRTPSQPLYTLLNNNYAHDVTQIAITPDGRLLACLDKADVTVKLWDLTDKGRMIRAISLQSDMDSVDLCAMAISPNGKVLATCCEGWPGVKIKLWSLASGTVMYEKVREGAEIFYAIAFSPDGQVLATGLNNRVELWHVPPRDVIDPLQEAPARAKDYGQIFSLSFSRDGQLIICGCSEGVTEGYQDAIVLWSLATQRVVRTFKATGHAPIYSVAVSPDGELLASGGTSVRLWRLRTGESLGTLEGHTDGVTGVAFSPDGQTLASCSQDGTISIWRRR